MNRIDIVGRLTRDPEFTPYKTKTTGEERELVKFRVAVTRPKTFGENKKTDFFSVLSFNQIAFCKFLAKGKLVSVSGVMEYEEYTKTDGTKAAGYTINATDIDILESGDKVVDSVDLGASNDKPKQAAPKTKQVQYAEPDVNVY